VRAFIAYAIVLLIGTAFLVQPAMAFTQMAVPFIDSCDFLVMTPTQYTDLTIAEYNNVYMATTSNETTKIDFPAFADGAHIGPDVARAGIGIGIDNGTGIGTNGTGIGISGGSGLGIGVGVGATANVLPFGPVDLAFPSISQTANDTYAYQRTYFFSDTSHV